LRSSVGINDSTRESILFSFYARPERLVDEVEFLTYFHFQVTYHTDQMTQAMLLIRWVGGGWGSNLSITRRMCYRL